MVGKIGGNTGTGGRSETGYYPAIVETARIVNVNVVDWTVDCISEFGSRKFFDIQVMSPYFHYFNGEGWYVMPEVGALCWVCQASSGLFAPHFVLGFQAPFDERDGQGSSTQAANFKANRQSLNPGDMMWRGRDENFIIMRRGGVLQVGASAACQRLFIPLNNLIRDMSFAYDCTTLAGDMAWQIDREDQDDAGDVKTRFRLRAKTKANEPEHSVILTAGSHEDDDNLRLSLEIRPSGAEDEAAVFQLQVDKEGTVNWIVEKDFSLDVKGDLTFASQDGDLSLLANTGKGSFKSKGTLALESTNSSASLTAKGSLSLKGATASLEGKQIALKGKTQVGGPGGEPIPKGLKLITLLTNILTTLSNPQAPAGVSGPPGSPILLPGLAQYIPQLQQILSTNHTVT